MSSRKSFRVRLFNRWTGTGARGHWVPTVGAYEIGGPDDAGDWRSDMDSNTVAIFEVDSPTRSAAADIVTHWLALGRPDIMAVREMWTRP